MTPRELLSDIVPLGIYGGRIYFYLSGIEMEIDVSVARLGKDVADARLAAWNRFLEQRSESLRISRGESRDFR